MAEFYSEADFALNRIRAAGTFHALISDNRLGYVWLIQSDSQSVGYVVVTLAFSMEYGGRSAVLDDLFIQKPFRGAGLGSAVMAEIRTFCESLEIRAVHVEVAMDNVAGQTVYRRVGFVSTDRQLLTLRLAEPSHAA